MKLSTRNRITRQSASGKQVGRKLGRKTTIKVANLMQRNATKT